MILTKRDLILFSKLQSYGLLRTSQIGAMVFAGVNLATVCRRLRTLEAAGYIKRELKLDGYEIAWSVTYKGGSAVGNLPIKKHFRTDTLGHDLKLTNLRLLLEGNEIAHSWIPEHEIRSSVAKKRGLRELKHRVVPDGLMGVNYKGSKESVAIELELQWKNSSRYKKIFEQYRMKDSIWAVWYLVPTESLGRAIERAWVGILYGGPKPKLFWSLVDEVLTEGKTARFFYAGESHRLCDIWWPKDAAAEATLPAQGAAQVLSIAKDKGDSSRLRSSDCDDKEKLTPAS